ncbi:MAG: hypothetical protein KZQ83_08955 [gamma proteobacterium symbiont of Taylorina sp.]|nr:hypothetical protein [gamma proteobacterium symbiont of Taylorina sp.]
MKKISNKFLIASLSIPFLLYGLFYPYMKGGCGYVAITSELDLELLALAKTNRVPLMVFAKDKISQSGTSCEKNYLIKEEKLYLLVQSTKQALFLVTSVKYQDWNAEKLKIFKEEHPELFNYWRVEGSLIRLWKEHTINRK